MKVAIIPARGGSKRIPRKNIKSFLGKPIISYSIAEAQKAALFDHIIVSTDSEEIAQIALEYGAEVPFIRPKELSNDKVGVAQAVLHAINWLTQKGMSIRYVCTIFTTSPLMEAKYIVNGLETLIDKNAGSAHSVTSFAFHAQKAVLLTKEGYMKQLWPELANSRSNELPETFHDAAQFYWNKYEALMKTKRLIDSNSLPIIIPRYLVQDINTLEDWKTAEMMYQAIHCS